MADRWPEPVRPPLPVGLITEADIDEAMRLCVRFLDDPEDPAWTPELFGAICGCRAALAECADALRIASISRRPNVSDRYTWEQLGREYVARKVARRVIDDLRQWLPENRNLT